MRTGKKLLTAVAAGFAALLFTASLVWACTGPTNEIQVNPKRGPAGTLVTINGRGFPPVGPVEIRWNEIEGKKLGEAPNGDFSVEVRIPNEASPDVYVLLAVQRTPVDTNTARDTFTVTPAASQGEGPPGQNQSGSPTGQNQAPGNEPVGDGSEDPADAARRAGPGGVSNNTGEDRPGQPRIVAPAPVRPGPPALRRGTVPEPGGPVGGAQAASNVAGQTGHAAAAMSAQAGPGGISPTTILGDLWTGLDSMRPELGNAPPPVPESNIALAAGLGMVALAACALALLGGFLVAERRKRQVLS